MTKRSLNPLRLLNSVPFGILLMVLTALYIAVGSGRPWLRAVGLDDFPVLRNWFDLTDLQFFSAWPLKVLMGLLVANLVVVTWVRIPLTPPRYGVWCVHIGIIVLILSTGFYYNRKLEGRVRLYTDPMNGPISTDHFYDKDERSLYLKVNDTPWNDYPLANLPRYKEYDASLGNADELTHRGGLTGIQPTLAMGDEVTGKPVTKTLSQWLGWKSPVSFDIVGYYPYANISTDFVDDPSSKVTGVHLTLPDIHEGQDVERWVVSADPRFRDISAFGSEFEQRNADATLLPALIESAHKLFRLDITLHGMAGAADTHQTLYVQPGSSYTLGNSGYQLAIENFDPAWNMFGTHRQVQALTMKVITPAQTFRRMVLDGDDVQTDFLLNAAGAGPMGKRQKKPLDDRLFIHFAFSDPYSLLPQDSPDKHTLITPAGGGLVEITAAFASPAVVHRFDSGVGDIDLAPPSAEQAPFASAAGGAGPADPPHPAVRVHLEREDHLRRDDSVIPVPPTGRDRNIEDSGTAQVAKVLVHFGDWSQLVVVPFTDEAGDMPNNTPWDGGTVTIPGINTTLQLQLSETRRALPAKVTLDRFTLVPYPGGDINNPRTLIRDFRSTLTVDDGDSTFTDVAHMNHPVYFRNGDWLLFQAAYDGQNRSWTQLGVGNRPGVHEMIAGCVMIFVGLLYAFYAKPIVIRNMKRRALQRVAAAKARAQTEEPVHA